MSDSRGQRLVSDLTKWIDGYMFLDDPRVALVAALWAINTWVFERFDACPYLCVTSYTMAAGKTRLMELLAMVSRNPHLIASMTPAAMLRMIEQADSKTTLFFDQAETLSGSSGRVLKNFMEIGYRRGQTVTTAVSGGRLQEFQVYCPKCFAVTGELTETLRHRSIEIRLEQGEPILEFYDPAAKRDGAAIVEQIKALLRERWSKTNPPAFLGPREAEIWASLFSVAAVLNLDASTLEMLSSTAADLVAKKAAPKESIDRDEHERRAAKKMDARRALRDLVGVLDEGEQVISAAVAVERMKGIETSRWGMFGLNEASLADLMITFDMTPANGYVTAEIRKAHDALVAQVAAARARLERSGPVSIDSGTIIETSDGPPWLEDLPPGGVRALFKHLDLHGTVTENEAITMLGGARGLRNFSNQFESLIKSAPFRISIRVVDGVKRFVREGHER